MQVAMQIWWNSLDDTIMPHRFLQNLWQNSLPRLPSLSLSSFPAFYFDKNSLFCFLLLIRVFILLWRTVYEKKHPSCRDWTLDFRVTDEGLTHWATGTGTLRMRSFSNKAHLKRKKQGIVTDVTTNVCTCADVVEGISPKKMTKT